MTIKLVAILMRPTPSMFTIKMQQRFWSFASHKRPHLRLVRQDGAK